MIDIPPMRQSIPGPVVTAGVLGLLHGGFVVFVFVALFSLSNGEIFTFDRAGTIIGVIGIVLGVNIVVSAILIFLGRGRWLLLICSLIVAVPALALLITGKFGGLLMVGLGLLPIAVAVLLLLPASHTWFRAKALTRGA